jgi:hypothetical protein
MATWQRVAIYYLSAFLQGFDCKALWDKFLERIRLSLQ